MINTLLGFKQEQTRKYNTQGVRIPVTYVRVEPAVVVQTKNQEKDGYLALQLGAGWKDEKNIAKPQIGHFKKAGLKKSPRFLREVRFEEANELGNYQMGNEIKLEDVVKPGDIVNVTGISKGKGFAGGVKRWGFHGGPRTHGQSDRERAPGSIGSTTTPGRVLKGKHMAGRMGGERVTVRNLEIVATDPEEKVILIKGLVPGAKDGLLLIKKVGEKKRFVPVELKPGTEAEVAEAETQPEVEAEVETVETQAESPVIEAETETSVPKTQVESEPVTDEGEKQE